MNEVMLASGLMTLFYALFALVTAWGVLRILDRLTGVNFREVLNEVITHDPMASASYFGLRFFGVCVLIGLTIS